MNYNNLRKIIRKSLLENMNVLPNISTSNKRENLKKYVEDNIDFTGYDSYKNIPNSQFLQAFINLFKEERDWDITKSGLKNAFIDYLRGLPSCLDIATYYTEIRNLLYALGYDEVKNMDDPEIDQLYYNELYSVFFPI